MRRPVTASGAGGLNRDALAGAMEVRTRPPQWTAARLGRSIVDRQALPDLIDPLVERVEAGVQTFVLKVEDIAQCQKSEDPVVALQIGEHLFDRVTDCSHNTPQDVHRIPSPFRE